MSILVRVVQHHKSIAWIIIGLLCVSAAAVRLAFIGYDLPWAAGGDEHFYFVWARAIRNNGSPDVESGSGYPPGYLYVYAGEQILIEKIMGSHFRPDVDYVLFGRVVDALLGAANIALIARLTWGLSRSSGAAVVAAALTVGYRLAIQEDRRAAPNTLWLTLTMAAFIFLIESIHSKNLIKLNLSMLFGAGSFLVKYSSGLFFVLPVAVLFLVLAPPRQKSIRIFLMWSAGLLLMAVWLALGYHALAITGTPGTQTGSIIRNGALVGFQSLSSNWSLLVEVVNNAWLIYSCLGLLLYFAVQRLLKLGEQIRVVTPKSWTEKGLGKDNIWGSS